MADREARGATFRRLGTAAPLHQTVQEEIRNFIVANRLGPGDPIKPEAELAREFGVSRNSVREAVKALESTGVLETRRGSGVYVRDFSFAPLLDHLPYGLMHGGRALRELVALRKALESAMIGDAMAAMKPETEQAMREVLAEMSRLAEAGQSFADQDREFHRLLFRDLGNAMLLQLFDLFWMAYNRAAPAMPGREPAEVCQNHVAILDAVVAGDLRQAQQAVQQHYTGIEDRLRD
ncbi:FadR/GntR family transcriptional regulator [Microlunatus parietis]|uniref:DNA-binding FadR family transcriptional regulator n=1 Tax=Microlunatus parietis TaxID=682979 RepID=A0A7Y9I735_9ACTN|nr:FadR/GntR family transcriptional regulator [Microlunatus parietis]NYE71260.1 DNA-binding FadR family transcriptional regulator [Microlunatus parietis]